MTTSYWTPEKKLEYEKLLKKRDDDREYHRRYMNDARSSGRYKYFRDGSKVIYRKDETADEENQK